MHIPPIHTPADYEAVLKEVSTVVDMDPAFGTPAGDRLDVLVTLVQAYETQHFAIDLPDPIEAIKFRTEQGGFGS